MCVGPNHTNYINRKLNFSAVTRIKVLLSFCMVRRISSEIQYLIWWWIRGEHWPDSSGQCPPDVFKKRYIEVVDAWHMLFAIEHRELTTTTTREQSSPQKGTAIRLAESLLASCVALQQQHTTQWQWQRWWWQWQWWLYRVKHCCFHKYQTYFIQIHHKVCTVKGHFTFYHQYIFNFHSISHSSLRQKFSDNFD